MTRRPAAWSLACLARTGKFHTAHKLTLMSHSPAHYQEMGRLVAKAGAEPWDEMVAAYEALLMEGLRVLGTRGKHVNARSVQHLMGYLKSELSGTAGKTRVEFLATPETRPHRVRGGDDTEGGWQSVRYFLSFYTTFSSPLHV